MYVLDKTDEGRRHAADAGRHHQVDRNLTKDGQSVVNSTGYQDDQTNGVIGFYEPIPR